MMLKEQKSEIQESLNEEINQGIEEERPEEVDCVRILFTVQDESQLRDCAKYLSNYWSDEKDLDYELKEELIRRLPRVNTQIQKELWASLLKNLNFSVKEKLFIVELLCFWLCSSISEDTVKINCMYTLSELINKNDFSRQTAISSIRNQMIWGSLRVKEVGNEILQKI
ncbi:hypothetical protein [Sediminitomix flava]|uniref:Uncharacterized protein n=1 Tax=Sediminitomix flava TaxID=379075 RepID=A0A315ZF11_SEDFL|nr:hypothetical protein [Sediminitomix flava]PWJ44145.1 hypothetical protein BC781_101495 [Sediminitomix flava]